jgi:hypothetical protein
MAYYNVWDLGKVTLNSMANQVEAQQKILQVLPTNIAQVTRRKTADLRYMREVALDYRYGWDMCSLFRLFLALSLDNL